MCEPTVMGEVRVKITAVCEPTVMGELRVNCFCVRACFCIHMSCCCMRAGGTCELLLHVSPLLRSSPLLRVISPARRASRIRQSSRALPTVTRNGRYHRPRRLYYPSTSLSLRSSIPVRLRPKKRRRCQNDPVQMLSTDLGRC